MKRRHLPGLLAALLVTGCMGIDVGSIRSVEPSFTPTANEGLVIGQIRHVVDGVDLRYGFLNKPALQLYRLDDRQYLATPETRSDGSYAWRLPPGQYGIAVIFGGMAPAGQPHWMMNGHLVFVNGVVDPGFGFTVEAGKTHLLGTLEIEVRSRPARADVFGERVFDALLGIRALEDGPAPPPRTDPANLIRRPMQAIPRLPRAQ